MGCEHDCVPTKDLNFKVPETFHKQFKVWSALQGKDMRTMLFEMAEDYRKRHPKLPKIH